MAITSAKLTMPTPAQALPGRADPMPVAAKHLVLGVTMKAPFPADSEKILFGMGCFWGAERRLWQQTGVLSTAVGYSAGFTPNPTYEEVCSGLTGHNEVVLVIYDPKKTTCDNLLSVFWESHNPTQGMRQGNDQGTQYRSAIYTFSDYQLTVAEESKQRYQLALEAKGFGKISTEILPASEFYYAEDYHQQYLAKNPNGYCGLGGTGVCFTD